MVWNGFLMVIVGEAFLSRVNGEAKKQRRRMGMKLRAGGNLSKLTGSVSCPALLVSAQLSLSQSMLVSQIPIGPS